MQYSEPLVAARAGFPWVGCSVLASETSSPILSRLIIPTHSTAISASSVRELRPLDAQISATFQSLVGRNDGEGVSVAIALKCFPIAPRRPTNVLALPRGERRARFSLRDSSAPIRGGM